MLKLIMQLYNKKMLMFRILNIQFSILINPNPFCFLNFNLQISISIEV